jgi:hypothetical protein
MPAFHAGTPDPGWGLDGQPVLPVAAIWNSRSRFFYLLKHKYFGIMLCSHIKGSSSAGGKSCVSVILGDGMLAGNGVARKNPAEENQRSRIKDGML